MKNEIFTYSTKTKIHENARDGRFVKLEDFASGKTDYIKELFENAKGFNVSERISANQFFA